jgi:hypothetical protein
MIIWRPDVSPKILAFMGFLLAVVSGCKVNSDSAVKIVAPPPTLPVKPVPAASASQPVLATGLTPLATPQQVVDAIPVGRVDPFATAESSSQKSQVPPLPDGFRLTGVIATRGRSQAFVQVGGNTGLLCTGPRGRCNDDQPLLPPGWNVTGVDSSSGLVAMTYGRHRQVIRVIP